MCPCSIIFELVVETNFSYQGHDVKLFARTVVYGLAACPDRALQSDVQFEFGSIPCAYHVDLVFL